MNAAARSAFAAAALVAFAGSAHAEAHTWWYVRFADATCVLSERTPEQYVNYANSPEGHAIGLSAERIAPDDVKKTATLSSCLFV